MEFNEDIAKELKNKFKFHDLTIKIWERRNEIPDYLFRESTVKIEGMTLREIRKYLNYDFDTAIRMLGIHGLKVSYPSLYSWEKGKKPNKNNLRKLIVAYSTLINQKRKLLGI